MINAYRILIANPDAIDYVGVLGISCMEFLHQLSLSHLLRKSSKLFIN